MRPHDLLHDCLDLRDRGISFVLVTMVAAIGSTPQDAGSKMIVTDRGLYGGTVGGGRIEAKAIDVGLAMLNDVESVETVFHEWNLQRDVGMTCGGVVKLFFEKVQQSSWEIVIFGAGHVAQALMGILVTLPCSIKCIDPRSEWLGKLPSSPNLVSIQKEDPAELVSTLSDRAFVLCMTKGHKSDFPVLHEIFKTKRIFPYIGVIGSKAKSAVLHRELMDAGIDKEDIKFFCPIGLPIGTNHPGEIALSIAAQLLQVRDSLKQTANSTD